ncbi:hypothetical protein PCH_Pc24g00770 [Penicillium rubens Wisconsin 54-1255]|uniref:Uncharacterized protein n=2 Tax=Penicillium TaxID=5073 RepID=B6HWN5_PENRW|nr:hypothetical protein PCH_Pc24g00770 [Penicillium rubens Wisconsin 54-1255]CRL31398.1 unnamed protein product [Penicillium camemberti]
MTLLETAQNRVITQAETSSEGFSDIDQDVDAVLSEHPLEALPPLSSQGTAKDFHDHRRVYVYPASPDLLQCQDLFGAQSLCYKSSSNSPTPINYAGGNGKLRSSGFWLRESFNIQISHQPTQPTGHNLISSSRIMTEDTIAVRWLAFLTNHPFWVAGAGWCLGRP